MSVEKSVKALIIGICLMAVVQPTYAFDVKGNHKVHQDVTRDALRNVNRDYGVTMSALAMGFVISGNVNTDNLNGPHKWGAQLNDYHVNNALNTNAQFVRSFTLVRNSIDIAASLARNNLRFLEPARDSGYIKSTLETVCRNVRRQPLCSPLRVPGFLHSGEYRATDPHESNYAENILKIVDPMIVDLESRNDTANVTRLNNVRNELRAYRARQLLGHAFHTLQDTFAHSNFVELMHGKVGPPCLGNFPDRTDICSRRAIPANPITQRFADPIFGEFYRMLGDGFALRRDTFRQALGSRARRFQTGSVLFGDLEPGTTAGDVLEQAFESLVSVRDTGEVTAGACPTSDSRDYCHWRGAHRPALNKDNSTNSAASQENFGHARRTALLASEIMWEHFLTRAELLPERDARLEVVTLQEGTPPEKRASLATNPLAPKGAIASNRAMTKAEQANLGTAKLQQQPKQQTKTPKPPKGSFEKSMVTHPRITLHLQKPSRLKLQLTYDFRAASGARHGGSCSPGVDLRRQAGRLQIEPGQMSANISVPLCPDSVPEDGESFRLRVRGGGIAPISQVFQVQDDDQPKIIQRPKLKLPLKRQLPKPK